VNVGSASGSESESGSKRVGSDSDSDSDPDPDPDMNQDTTLLEWMHSAGCWLLSTAGAKIASGSYQPGRQRRESVISTEAKL